MGPLTTLSSNMHQAKLFYSSHSVSSFPISDASWGKDSPMSPKHTHWGCVPARGHPQVEPCSGGHYSSRVPEFLEPDSLRLLAPLTPACLSWVGLLCLKGLLGLLHPSPASPSLSSERPQACCRAKPDTPAESSMAPGRALAGERRTPASHSCMARRRPPGESLGCPFALLLCLHPGSSAT